MVTRLLLSLAIFTTLLGFQSCSKFIEEFGEEPYYLAIGDTLNFSHIASYSDSDYGNSTDVDVSVFEDPSFGISIYNKIFRLKIIELDPRTVQLIPLQTGETTLVVKTVTTYTCNSCFAGPTFTYKYYTIVITR
jgi:hypothetical protein